jgi:hypothetical protein
VDLVDVIYLIVTRGPFVPPLLFLLTILLRVACHFAGVEIPVLGRAFVVATATALLSAIAALVPLVYFGPVDTSPNGLIILFGTLVFSLLANLLVSVGLYRLLLGITFQKALSVWLIQAVSFLAVTVAACCLIGGPVYLFFS